MAMRINEACWLLAYQNEHIHSIEFQLKNRSNSITVECFYTSMPTFRSQEHSVFGFVYCKRYQWLKMNKLAVISWSINLLPRLSMTVSLSSSTWNSHLLFHTSCQAFACIHFIHVPLIVVNQMACCRLRAASRWLHQNWPCFVR